MTHYTKAEKKRIKDSLNPERLKDSDKKRIDHIQETRDICDLIANIWAQTAPQKTFSDIITELNMLTTVLRENIRHGSKIKKLLELYFDGHMSAQKDLCDSFILDCAKLKLLADEWEKFASQYKQGDADTEFDENLFSRLFAKACNYFRNPDERYRFSYDGIRIICAMYALKYYDYYPKGIFFWKFDACIEILDEFLKKIDGDDSLWYAAGKNDYYFPLFSSNEYDIRAEIEKRANEIYADESGIYDYDYYEYYDENGNLYEDLKSGTITNYNKYGEYTEDIYSFKSREKDERKRDVKLDFIDFLDEEESEDE